MTGERDGPDLEEAARMAQESRRQALEQERQSRERATHARSLARWLHQLRVENGFDQLFDSAIGGGRA